ncbi:hypothetical protein CLV94_3053 [Flavobacterium endophyticum]|uniref:Uncharacterized protein n=1 Tax=Flavobacterium endophyticum TaxID=1540163 RepID=A0A495M1A6_9FLAO|nr:hypothetical protein [Flavobacterium endophyticum]RKS19102.1 hypothetical protein CLV94_3053 [Flavobacterium endophyticum]
MFLIAVKQGNITRNNWDSSTTSVRPTLNEILDFYIPKVITKSQKLLPKKIVVCTNGELDQTVLNNWNGFIDNATTKEIEFEFWGIDKIVSLVDRHLIPEQIFPNEYKTLLRKTLAFIDLVDYDLNHYYSLLENLFSKKNTSKKQIVKTLRIVRICFNTIIKWSEDAENLKPAFIASERTLLLSWKWMRENNLLKENYVLDEFYQIHQMKIKVGREYFLKTREHFYVKHSLFKYSRNQLEYSLTVWEQIGILSSLILVELFEAEIHYQENTEYSKICYSNVREYVTGLQYLITNNPPSKYPEYDEHLIEISLALIALFKTQENKFASQWIEYLISGLNDYYKLKKFIPLFTSDYEKLANIHLGNDISEPHSSMLIPILIEWSVILNEPKLYELIKKLIDQNYPEINLQIWFPEMTTENYLFNSNMSRNSGHTKCSINLYSDFQEYKNEMIEEKALLFEEKDFTIFKNYFYYLGYLSSRHYRSNLLPVYWREFLNESLPS